MYLRGESRLTIKKHHYCNHVLLKIHLSIMQNKQIQRFLHFSNKYVCGSPCKKIYNDFWLQFEHLASKGFKISTRNITIFASVF